MTRTKIFCRMYRDPQGKCGFTTLDNKFISASSMRYKDMFVLFKVGYRLKGKWVIMSTSPFRKIYKNRQYFLLGSKGKEIKYNIVFNIREHIVDNLNRIVSENKFNDEQNEFILENASKLGHKNNEVFITYDIILLGQHIDNNDIRYPVAINIENTNEFLYYEKSLIKDEEIILTEDGSVVSAEKPVISYDSEMYDKALDKWIEGFDDFFIMNKSTDSGTEKLLIPFEYIIDKIL